MAYEKVPRPSTVYHLTQKGNLDSILDDGMIRRFNDICAGWIIWNVTN